jgi:glycosyltransferase involved in cell wall biosynthesis
VSMSTRISIAMAVYNGGCFISEQLESMIRQTRLPDELVVSDNASTDLTIEIVREFAARAPFPVRLFINDSNLGVTKNFERAITECTGDIIFLSDSDDVWYPEKIEVMAQLLEINPHIAIALCDADIVDEALHPTGQRVWQRCRFLPTAETEKRMSDTGPCDPSFLAYGNAMAFRAMIKPLILPLPDSAIFKTGLHDGFIVLAATCSGTGGIGLVRKPLVAYRQHRNQMSGDCNNKQSLVHRLGVSWAARKERPRPVLLPVIERFGQHPALHDPRRAYLKEMLLHANTRYTLPRQKLKRIPLITAELVSLRYQKFSNGLITAVRDALFVE